MTQLQGVEVPQGCKTRFGDDGERIEVRSQQVRLRGVPPAEGIHTHFDD